MAHLWLGTTGISGESPEAQIEKYCDDVAGEILLPAADIRVLRQVHTMELAEAVAVITAFATARKVSRGMVAYKLLSVNAINEHTWRQLAGHFKQEWLASRERESDDNPSTASSTSGF